MTNRRSSGAPAQYANGLRAVFLLATLAVLSLGLLATPGHGVAAPSASELAKPSCKIAHPTGQSTVPLTSAGAQRPFEFYVPPSYNGRKLLPLVLNLHASGSNGPAQMDVSEMAAAAGSAGYAVAAPDGAVSTIAGGFLWNVPGVPLVSGEQVPPGTPSDERYLLDVIRAAKKTVCVDPKRIYLTGFSGGARMASQMACDYSQKIAAIAPVAGLRAGVPRETSPDVWAPDPATCKPKEPVPVRTFHGTADTTNPFVGNDDARWGYSVDAALARWAKIDRCRKGPKSAGVSPTVSLVSYGRCKSGASVELYRQEGAGHTWPGGAPLQGAPIDESIDASQLALRFFADHTLADRRK